MSWTNRILFCVREFYFSLSKEAKLFPNGNPLPFAEEEERIRVVPQIIAESGYIHGWSLIIIEFNGNHTLDGTSLEFWIFL